MRLVFIILFFSLIIKSYGQDTIPSNQTIRKIDTIIIYKDPVIITKSIIVEAVQTPQSAIWIEAYGAINYYSSYYNVCSNCIDYYKKVNNATKVLPGTSAGLNMYYMRGKILGIAGVSYSDYREKFTYATTKYYINTFNYIEAIAGIGYLIKGNKLSYAITTGVSISTLSSFQGYTYSSDSLNSIVALGNVRKYNSTIPGILGSFKFLYKISEKFRLTVEPYYRFDLNSVIYKKSQFTEQRNIFALKAGLLFVLK